MEKPVIISIKSTQNMDGQEDTIELVTQGSSGTARRRALPWSIPKAS